MSFTPSTCENAGGYFRSPLEHLEAELRRLDLLLHREILRLRATYQLSLDEFRGLYISDEQVDQLVSQGVNGSRENPDIIGQLTTRAEVLRAENAARLPPDSPWARLAETFNLSSVEQDVLLLAVAPEIDRKYETLYAYLNNDVTRKWPSCELALRVFALAPSSRVDHRPFLLPQGKLFQHNLLRLIPPGGDKPRWLGSAITVLPVVINFLLDQPSVDQELAAFVELSEPRRSWDDINVPSEVENVLRNLARHVSPSKEATIPTILIFEARKGAGRRLAVEAFANQQGSKLLTIDLQAARASGESLVKLVSHLLLHQRLYDAVLYLSDGEMLFDREGHPLSEAATFINTLGQASKQVVIASAPGHRWHEVIGIPPFLLLPFRELSAKERTTVWNQAVKGHGWTIPKQTLHEIADRFILTPGQIEGAVARVAQIKLLESGLRLDARDSPWFEAARDQSDQSLGELAAKVRTLHTWDDLVLPKSTLDHLRQITDAIRYRGVVYEDWGFESRLAIGKGLKLLFSGPSGTGKTMTAGVMARDLGLELYRIDLSCIVSKYIGETEKNLDRIFRAAHCSNAILFFDEADALFGKRSEVKDAHDRYANIEVAYLLQKLDEHDGAVILATNLSKNIDQAFARRMHYVVRFPLPDAADRERLWRGIFPAQAPLGKKIDFKFVAEQFSFTGGDIKNIALETAFRAAADGQVITMTHLLRAIAQHLVKEGHTPSVADFRQYYDLLKQDR